MPGWDDLAEWWLGEIASDPAYETDVLPLLVDVFDAPAGVVLDAGCGEGRVMEMLRPDHRAIGCDLSAVLLEQAKHRGPVVRARLPSLAWIADASVAGLVAVMVVEHLADAEALLREARRVAVPGGTLTVVMNHPAYTAAGSGPIVDQTDGEVLWRWGPYFDAHSTAIPAGEGTVEFHHRPLGSLLTAAAASGWSLEVIDERPLGPEAITRDPGLVGQEQFPRLLGARWRALGGAPSSRE